MIEENPSFGYRTVAALLGFNKNTVQRIFQLKGWQVRKRPVGFRPRVQALPRITSYNVCYTKLLRQRHTTIMPNHKPTSAAEAASGTEVMANSGEKQ